MRKNIRSRTEQLAAVTSVMSTLVETRNVHEAAGILLQSALNLLRSEYGIIGAITEGSGLRILAREGQGSEQGQKIFHQESLRLIRAVTDGVPLLRSAQSVESRSGDPTSIRRHTIAIPVGKEPDIVGVIGLERESEEFEVSDAETIDVLLQAGRILCESNLEEERREALDRKRRQAEEALRDSEENFRTLIGHSPDVIMKIDPDATIRFINYTLPEYSVDRVIGTKATAYLSEADGRRYLEGLRRVVESGEPDAFEVSAAGSTRWNVRLVPIKTDGPTESILVIASNITELQWKIEELESVLKGTSTKVGEEFFTSLTKHLAGACRVRFAFISEVTDARKTRVRLHACWSGSRFEEAFEYDTAGTPCAKVFEQGVVFYPIGAASKFPEDRWLVGNKIESYLAIPIVNMDGEAIGHMGVMNDQAMDNGPQAEAILRTFAARAGAELNRMRAEQGLLESQRSLSTLLQNLPGMVYRCRNDRDWTVEFASEGAQALTGHLPEDFVTGKVSYGTQIIHPEDQEPVWRQVQDALRERKRFQLTYRIQTKAKKEKWVWEQGCGIFDSQGNLLALEGFITDITHQQAKPAV